MVGKHDSRETTCPCFYMARNVTEVLVSLWHADSFSHRLWGQWQNRCLWMMIPGAIAVQKIRESADPNHCHWGATNSRLGTIHCKSSRFLKYISFRWAPQPSWRTVGRQVVDLVHLAGKEGACRAGIISLRFFKHLPADARGRCQALGAEIFEISAWSTMVHPEHSVSWRQGIPASASKPEETMATGAWGSKCPAFWNIFNVFATCFKTIAWWLLLFFKTSEPNLRLPSRIMLQCLVPSIQACWQWFALNLLKIRYAFSSYII